MQSTSFGNHPSRGSCQRHHRISHSVHLLHIEQRKLCCQLQKSSLDFTDGPGDPGDHHGLGIIAGQHVDAVAVRLAHWQDARVCGAVNLSRVLPPALQLCMEVRCSPKASSMASCNEHVGGGTLEGRMPPMPPVTVPSVCDMVRDTCSVVQFFLSRHARVKGRDMVKGRAESARSVKEHLASMGCGNAAEYVGGDPGKTTC